MTIRVLVKAPKKLGGHKNMTTERLKAVVTTLRQEGMSSEEILDEMGPFLKISQKTLNAMRKAGMTADDILKEVTTDYEYSVKLEGNLLEKETTSRKDIGEIKKYLREVVGIPPHIKGYRYIATAINIWEDGMSMTKDLYPEVAKRHDTTPSRVERAIRHAIELVFDRNFDFVQSIGNAVSPFKGKPTNSEFITTLVEILEE